MLVPSVTRKSIARPIGATTVPSFVLRVAVFTATADRVSAVLVDEAVGVPFAKSPVGKRSIHGQEAEN